MRKLLLALCLVAGVSIVAAQEAVPTFEVASVKQNTSGEGFMRVELPPGNRLSITNLPLRQLVTMAYQLQQFQLVGGPSWITSDRFDIVAKIERRTNQVGDSAAIAGRSRHATPGASIRAKFFPRA